MFICTPSQAIPTSVFPLGNPFQEAIPLEQPDRFVLCVSQPFDNGGNPPEDKDRTSSSGLSTLRFGTRKQVTDSVSLPTPHQAIAEQSFTARVAQTTVARIHLANAEQIRAWNGRLSQAATPDTFYALGRYFQFGARKDLAQRTLKEISFEAIRAVCLRCPYEAFSLIAYFRRNGSPRVREQLDDIIRELLYRLYPNGERQRREAWDAMQSLEQLVLKDSNDDLTGWFRQININPFIFGYLLFCAVIKNNDSAVAYLLQLTLAPQDNINPNSLTAQFLRRAHQVVARFELGK